MAERNEKLNKQRDLVEPIVSSNPYSGKYKPPREEMASRVEDHGKSLVTRLCNFAFHKHVGFNSLSLCYDDQFWWI